MTALHIVLQGLLAVVPSTSPGGATEMQAILVASKDIPAEADSRCVVEHHPMLTLQTQTDAECSNADCKSEAPFCKCRQLAGRQIRIEVLPKPAPAETSVPRQIPRPLPFSRDTAGQYSYVASLSALGQALNPEVLGSSPPPRVLARMALPYQEVLACSLGTRRDDGVDNVHPMNFRPLGEEEGGEHPLLQAAAEALVATVNVDQEVKVILSNFDGSDPRTMKLRPHANGYYVIKLENHRSTLNPGDPCEDGVGRDFAFLYELAQPSRPAWNKRKIPHVKYSQWKSATDLQPELCREMLDVFKGPMSRPICPIASFDQ